LAGYRGMLKRAIARRTGCVTRLFQFVDVLPQLHDSRMIANQFPGRIWAASNWAGMFGRALRLTE